MKLGLQDKIDTYFHKQPPGREDYAWTAWYADDEPDDYGDMVFGYGSTEERARTNLVVWFPRQEAA